MNTRFQPGLRLFLALLTASFLLLALSLRLFAFVAAENAPANWHAFSPASGAWQHTHTIQTAVTVTDGDGLTYDAAYQLSGDGIGWSEWMTRNLQVGGTISTTRYLTVTAITLQEGVNYIQYAITDSLGTMEISQPAAIHIDTQPPAAPRDLHLSPTGWQTATNAAWTAAWRNPVDLSGVVTACYKIGAAPNAPDDGRCVDGDDIESISDIIPAEDGAFDFYLWLQDRAGNSNSANAGVVINGIQWDITPPSVYMDVFGHIGQNNWYTDVITIQINAVDEESGVAQRAYNLDQQGWIISDSLSITEDGVHQIIARATDAAGHGADTQPRQLQQDRTAPTTRADIEGTPDDQGWYETPVTITLQAQDATSGVATTSWQTDGGAWRPGTTIILDSDGKHALHFYSKDKAGNKEEIQEKPIWIDQNPPVTSYAILSSEEPVNGWYRQPVTVTLVSKDDGIGVDATYYRLNGGKWRKGETFRLAESGNYDVEFYAVDLLGRTEPISSISDGIHIDTAPPRSPSPLDLQPRGWTNINDFNLLMALPPDLSGIAGAYVKVGQPPLAPTDGQWHPGAHSALTHVQTPGEGAFKAYVWLQDNAENVDHGNYGVWEGALSLKYDATAPTTQMAVAGDLGKNGWYVSPITVTLLPTDSLSGPDQTIARLDAGHPTTATVLHIAQQDKHTLRYYSVDHAGNREAERLATLRIDYKAPDSPQNITVQPHNWTLTNTFTITWDNPDDVSGIGVAYYKVGAPPTRPEDGIPISPTGLASGVSAPGEGSWDLYLWLEDRAGNVDVNSWKLLKDGLRYDATPPTSIFTILEGTLGGDHWYRTPVKALISPSDDGSGPAGVRYRVNEGEWQYAEHEALIEIDHTGIFDISYQAVDVAGNKEPVQHTFVKVDIDAPSPQFLVIDRYQRESSFIVSWMGVDQSNGSGVQGFDLQSRDGRNGAWITWGASNTPDLSRRYYGNYGHRYFFRLRARDVAGNTSDWVEMPWGVYIDRLQDGDFATGFGLWRHGGALAQHVIAAAGPYGTPVQVAQLGSPDYGPNNDFSQPGTVPIGSAAITQTVRIPGVTVLDHPMLTFWYRIRTYDAEYSDRYQKYYDTLDVRLIFGDASLLALRTGQSYEQWKENEGRELADLGWRMASIPIPRNMIDEMITISIENWNRNDHYLNTWTQVTDIRVWEPYRLFLPNLTGGSQTAELAEKAIQANHGRR